MAGIYIESEIPLSSLITLETAAPGLQFINYLMMSAHALTMILFRIKARATTATTASELKHVK